MKTVMFNSEKGGTGKTTLSTLAAAYLAVVGYRVLMLDFDPQANATKSFKLPAEPGLFEVIARGKEIGEWLRKPDPEMFAPSSGVKGELYVLPGDEDTHAVPLRAHDEYALVEMLEDLEDAFDIAIIDTAPSAGMLLTLPWKAADYVIIPTQLEYLSIDGVAGTIVRAEKNEATLLGIVPNMYQSTVVHDMYLDMLKEAAEVNGWTIWEPIARRIEWAEASSMRTMMWAIDAGMTKARTEAIQFCKRIEKAIGANVKV
jgi:chromosome partitioning protein